MTARVAANDPRLSVQERYPSFAFYKTKVVLAVDRLVRDRFLICDDTQDIVNRLLLAGITAGVPAPGPNESAASPDPVPACQPHTRPHYHYHRVFDGDGDGDDHDHH
jgi:hypothetical protein